MRKPSYEIARKITQSELRVGHFLDFNHQEGVYNIIEVETGHIVGKMSSEDIKENRDLTEYNVDGVKHYLSDGLDPEKFVGHSKKIAFSWALAQMICHRIATNEGLSKICQEPDMPSYFYVTFWRKNIPEFAQMLEIAYEARGEYIRDEIAEDSKAQNMDSDRMVELESKKARVDNLKWLASKDNNRRYGNKTEVTVDKPSVIIIETGIRKQGKVLEDYSQMKDVGGSNVSGNGSEDRKTLHNKPEASGEGSSDKS